MQCCFITCAAVHRTEEVSLITQGMYCLVFIYRYLDLFIPDRNNSMWNYVLKIFYILSSLYIMFLMLPVYARTREREKAWKFGGVAFVGSAIVAPFVMMIFKKKGIWSFVEVCYTSIVLSASKLVTKM